MTKPELQALFNEMVAAKVALQSCMMHGGFSIQNPDGNRFVPNAFEIDLAYRVAKREYTLANLAYDSAANTYVNTAHDDTPAPAPLTPILGAE